MFHQRFVDVEAIRWPYADVWILLRQRGIDWIFGEVFSRHEFLAIDIDGCRVAVYQKDSVHFIGAKRILDIGNIHHANFAKGADEDEAFAGIRFCETYSLRRGPGNPHLGEKTLIQVSGITFSAFLMDRGENLRRRIPDRIGS